MKIETLLAAIYKEEGKVAQLRLRAEADGSSDYAYYDGMFEGLQKAEQLIQKIVK